VASTVVDVTSGRIDVLREGTISAEALQNAIDGG
jgi:tRNA A37 threonylcarbamoyladenosine synthetase subunit TsaC/SUA5/YrdC